MKLKCLHGYYIFSETKPGQISDFIKLSGYDLVLKNGVYIFNALVDAPKYSIKGKSYLGVTASKTFEGEVWEVFEQNNFVFDFTKNKLVNITSINGSFDLRQNGNYYTANGMILAGTKASDMVVKSYTGFFSRVSYAWTYSGVIRG